MTQPSDATHEAAHGSVAGYSLGFGLSIGLTLAAYYVTTRQLAHGWALVFDLAGLAVVQLFVQLVCFLHLGRESRPRWNLTVLLFAAMVVGILVFGSLWIMNNLNYGHEHLPSGANADQFIIKDEGYRPSNY